MKSFPTAQTDAVRLRSWSGAGRIGRDGQSGFTLAEVLAALLLMAIIIPVALEGMSVISRSAILGQRKVAAMRVAERVLNEQVAVIEQGQAIQTSATGVETDGDQTYPWTMQTEPWPEDTMTQMTVEVTFTMRGSTFQMKASTLFDPGAATPGVAGTPPPTGAP